MIKRISGLVLLVVMMICSAFLSVTYSKYLLSKSVSGKVTTKANCLDMGINSLGECMLIMDSNITDVESSKAVQAAKSYISLKVANLTKMAPTIKYAEKSELVTNENGIWSSYVSYVYYQSYTFDSSTGIYTLGGESIRGQLSDEVINYYTCESYGNQCSTMYQVKDYNIITTDTSSLGILTSATIYTQISVDSFDSEIGLYATDDDNGTSYYYRGNVKNNYVSYAGYIWKIVRQNGDGSIRMIYSGDETTDTGTDTFTDQVIIDKTWNADPAYSGYMYDEQFALFENDNYNTAFAGFYENVKIYFAKSYQHDKNTNMFYLTGDSIYGTWKDNYKEIIDNYPYTCRSSSLEDKCRFMVRAKAKLDDYDYMMIANLITYSSESYTAATTNKFDSSLKESVDTWYESNILNKEDSKGNLLDSYLSDGIFCNDRKAISGTGYISSETTLYSPYNRIVNNAPSLLCNQENDRFTVTNPEGNGALTYPVGLLTADEAMHAGLQYNTVNTLNYLNVGETYWTMTPFYYDPGWGVNRFVYITQGIAADYVGSSFGIRPVINLRSDIKITSGDGTAENPYIVSL